MLRFEEAEDVRQIAEKVVRKYGLNWIDLNRVHFIRSFGSKSRAIARCYGLPRIWQFCLKEKPRYIVEVISEKFYRLSDNEKEKVILHELLHIPKSFSGGLLNHSQLIKRLQEIKKKSR